MAATTSRMRLTIDVLSLADEDSYGPGQYREAALAALKGRRFALPVQVDHTFEQVWSQIEERYKRNYLKPHEAACFTIKNLQDAYECDLDLGDTVASIFEGETDPKKRLIKVIPTFTYRDFSLPFDSNLRPASAQKRHRELHEEHASKRRRTGDQTREYGDHNRTQTQLLPSTESEYSANGDPRNGHIHTDRSINRPRSSKSRGSIECVQAAITGQREFSLSVKSESPELGLPTLRTIPDVRESPCAPSSAPSVSLHEDRNEHESEAGTEVDLQNQAEDPIEDIDMDDDLSETNLPTAEPNRKDANPGYEHSPESLDSQPLPIPPAVAAPPRKNIYEISVSPQPFGTARKPRNTYSRRHPLRTPSSTVKKDIMHSRNSGKASPKSSDAGRSTSKAHAFKFSKPVPDEIVSTQDGSAHGALREQSPFHAKKSLSMVHQGRNPRKNDSSDVEVDYDGEDITPSSNGRSKKPTNLPKPSQKSYKMPTGTSIHNSTATRTTAQSPVAQSMALAANGAEDIASPASRRGRLSPQVVIHPKPATISSDNNHLGAARSSALRSENAMVGRHASSTPLRDDPEEAARALQEFRKSKIAPPTTAESITANIIHNSSGDKPNRMPKRTAIPLPDNIRHRYAGTSSASPVPLSKHVKAQTERIVKAAKALPAIPSQPVDPSNVFHKPGKLVPNNLNHRKSDLTSASPAPNPRRSQIPLPDNIRHRFESASSTSPVSKNSSPANKKVVHEVQGPSTVPVSTQNSSTNANAGDFQQNGNLHPTHTTLGATAKDVVELSSANPSSSSDSLESEDEEDEDDEQGQDNETIQEEFDSIADVEMKRGATRTIDSYAHDRNLDQANFEASKPPSAPPDQHHPSLPPQLTGPINISRDHEDNHIAQADGNLIQNGTVIAGEEAATRLQSPTSAEPSVREPGNTQAWSFARVGPHSDTLHSSVQQAVSNPLLSRPLSRSPSAVGIKPDVEIEKDIESESASEADSNQSSPDAPTRSARLLSIHSPTPENLGSGQDSSNSSSDSDSETEAPKKPANDDNSETSESSSDESSSDDEHAQDDIEDKGTNMSNRDTTMGAAPPSSPPPMPTPIRQAVPSSQVRVPSTSQALPGSSQVPLAGSQSVHTPWKAPQRYTTTAGAASARGSAARSNSSRYGFLSLKEQALIARSTPTTAQKAKNFDPSSQSMARLSSKKLKKIDLSASEDDSSSDSDSDSDGVAQKTKEGCQVI
ncbi:hypothetical protein B0J11DRAFT_612542 [Dendryphion nanum]|uniref:Nucleolar protein Dnt1-like N-terminal domain-containing protein n=1 Tax=Dendryphion nanum TaxID=256645 RepID=A0A9P9E7N8_9PLEO|nr:hypothetical protein B0J11DRAFT_612542 [Dendryphion nanum]